MPSLSENATAGFDPTIPPIVYFLFHQILSTFQSQNNNSQTFSRQTPTQHLPHERSRTLNMKTPSSDERNNAPSGSAVYLGMTFCRGINKIPVARFLPPPGDLFHLESPEHPRWKTCLDRQNCPRCASLRESHEGEAKTDWTKCDKPCFCHNRSGPTLFCPLIYSSLHHLVQDFGWPERAEPPSYLRIFPTREQQALLCRAGYISDRQPSGSQVPEFTSKAWDLEDELRLLSQWPLGQKGYDWSIMEKKSPFPSGPRPALSFTSISKDHIHSPTRPAPPTGPRILREQHTYSEERERKDLEVQPGSQAQKVKSLEAQAEVQAHKVKLLGVQSEIQNERIKSLETQVEARNEKITSLEAQCNENKDAVTQLQGRLDDLLQQTRQGSTPVTLSCRPGRTARELEAEDEARRVHRERIDGLRQKHNEDREKEEAERVQIRQKRQKRLARERKVEQQERDQTMKDAE
jgi:uncharacterized coiled-coil protein SlyX